MSNIPAAHDAPAASGEHPLAKFGVVVEHQDPDELVTNLTAAIHEWQGGSNDIIACLPVLLVALGWNGRARALADTLPPQDQVFDITALQNLMGRLGYSSQVQTRRSLSPKTHLPALVLPPSADAFIVLSLNGSQTVSVYDLKTGTIQDRPLKAAGGTIVTFDTLEDIAPESSLNWYQQQIRRFGRLWAYVLMLTGLSNVLALSIPVFVLLAYDRVIPTGSMTTLFSIAAGVGLALVTDLVVRKVRRLLISHASARIGYLSGAAVFDRLLSLPTAMTEKASIGAQIARIRDLERVKEFISGPLGASILDVPFILVFVGAIAVIAGWLAVVPLFAALFYVACGIAFSRKVAREVETSAKLNSRRQEFVIELIRRLRAIKAAGSTRTWIDRYEDISELCAKENAKNARTTSLITIISQVMMLSAGLITLGTGVHLVIDGSVTTGGLIAAMILVWRAMAPMQGMFVFLTRVDQLKNSIVQTNRLLALTPERSGGLPLTAPQGHVSFANVTFRYPGEADPAFSNVSFEAKPGEVTAIVGKNGSGKSSVLKLVAGLYQPLAGSIKIDGRDIRQIAPRDLRQMIAFVSQSPHFFNGTIAENMRMSNSLASRDEIVEALEMAGAWEAVEALPEGLETFISARQTDQFSNSLMMRLSLARAYLRKAPIVLLDEPITGLDFEAEYYFTSAIDHLRESSTVFIITHRPSHLRAADNVLILEGGQVRYFGAAVEVRGKIPAHLI